MLVLKHKVFAYITHGDRLLIFRHPYVPEAGLQVPAGTVRDGERLDEAVMREVAEETGLDDIVLIRYLGEQLRDMSDFGRGEMHHRRFYHLRCGGDPPTTWRHEERDPSDESTRPIVFEFFWVRLPHEVPELIADHGRLLPQLLASLATPV